MNILAEGAIVLNFPFTVIQMSCPYPGMTYIVNKEAPIPPFNSESMYKVYNKKIEIIQIKESINQTVTSPVMGPI